MKAETRRVTQRWGLGNPPVSTPAAGCGSAAVPGKWRAAPLKPPAPICLPAALPTVAAHKSIVGGRWSGSDAE